MKDTYDDRANLRANQDAKPSQVADGRAGAGTPVGGMDNPRANENQKPTIINPAGATGGDKRPGTVAHFTDRSV